MAGKMKRVLVTGGTGYIGSHTTVELQQAGYEVIIIDNLSNSKKETLDGIEKITHTKPSFYCFDLCDRKQVFDFFNENNEIAAVVHFAGFKAVGESVVEPVKYYHNNLTSLVNLLDGMASSGTQNIVFSSSCTVYGRPEKSPVTEESPVQKPASPYGNTKRISEEILADAIVSREFFRAIALRYFNPIGSHPSSCIGELPIGVPNNLIPFVTQTAIGIREMLNIFGGDYNTPDGTCIRDYINVVDLARAHVSAVTRLAEEKQRENFEIYNLGTGRGVSVLEIVRAFEDVSGVKVNYKIAGRRSGDIEQIWADTSLANHELGWKAESSLRETLLSAWNWEQKLARQGKANQG